MLVWELFEDADDKYNLKDTIMDVLIPIRDSGIDKITIDQLIEKLDDFDIPLKITKELLMDMQLPAFIKFIKRIDNHYIYLDQGYDDEFDSDVGEIEKERQQEKIKIIAGKQAMKNLKK